MSSKTLYSDVKKPSHSITMAGLGLVALSQFTSTQFTNTKIDCGNGIKLVYEQIQQQDVSYLPNNIAQHQNIIYFEKLISFAEKFIESQVELDYESRKYLEENFWDLV